MSATPPADAARANAGVPLLGRPQLGLRHALAQALGLGPAVALGAAVFLVAGAAGPVAPLVLVLATGGILAAGWSVTLYVRRYASAGGLWPAVAQVHGPTAGLSLALLLAFNSLLVLSGLSYLASGLIVQHFAVSHLGFDPGWWAGGVAGALVTFAVVAWGVVVAVRVQLVLVSLSVVPFVVFAGAVLLGAGDVDHTLSVFDPGNADRGDTLRGLLLALTLFAGWELAASLGEEARFPHATISRAMVLAISLTGILFVAVTYAGVVAIGPDRVGEVWGQDPFALTGAADRVVGEPLGLLIDIAIVVDLVALLVAQYNAVSRVLMSLGREGLLPRAVGRVWRRRETPVAGLALVTVAGVAVLLAVAVTGGDPLGAYAALATGGALIALPVLLAVVAGAARLLAREGRAPLWWLVLAAGTAAPALALYGTLQPLPTGPAATGVLLALLVLGCGAGWTAWLRRHRPRAFAAAGAHALTSEGAGG